MNAEKVEPEFGGPIRVMLCAKKINIMQNNTTQRQITCTTLCLKKGPNFETV